MRGAVEDDSRDGATEPIVLFVPCFVDQLRPSAGVATLEVLESLGHAVEIRPSAICCGQPFTNSGCQIEGDRATELWFERMGEGATVVVPSSSCAVHLRHWQAGAASSFAGVRVRELCEFLEESHPDRRGGSLPRSICLHSSCHGLRDSKADADARRALARIDQLTTVRAERSDECCGFGGAFSVNFPEISVRMGRDRLAEIEATGVEEVVATDLSCLLHLEGIARARGRSLAFRHIAEVIREALR